MIGIDALTEACEPAAISGILLFCTKKANYPFFTYFGACTEDIDSTIKEPLRYQGTVIIEAKQYYFIPAELFGIIRSKLYPIFWFYRQLYGKIYFFSARII